MRARCRRHLVNVLERTQQTSLLRLAPPPLNPPPWKAHHPPRRPATTTTASSSPSPSSDPPMSSQSTLTLPSEARFNEIGIQHVSTHIHRQLFPPPHPPPPDPALVALSKQHLARHDLLGKTAPPLPPIAFDLPPLHGASLDEHFHRLGLDAAEPYLTLARKFARANPPPKPRRWVRRSGWTKYHPDGTSEAVDAPNDDALVFDTEVMWHETSFPAMACAASGTHWYAWLSPWLLGESANDRHLIPLGDPQTSRMVVGHNIGYDRARIREEYDLRQSRNFYMDTMSLHVAVNGMCSRQRPGWNKARKAREMRDRIAESDETEDLSALLHGHGAEAEDEEEMWVGRSSANSLRDVAKFHCNITIDKARREWFGELDRAGIVDRLDELLDYCAADVDVTHKVYKKVFPLFLETCPHPVSFAALRHLSTEILPVTRSWEAYLANAEATYHRLSSAVEQRLVELAEKAVQVRQRPEVYENDPWLLQLDWGGQEVRMVKGKRKDDPPRPSAAQKLPGMPNWYRDLFPRKNADIALTVRSRIAPLLFRMAWDGHPLVWSDKFGWTFKVAHAGAATYRRAGMTECDMLEEQEGRLKDDRAHAYFKLPHTAGPAARCASPIAKGYLAFFEAGTLSSEVSAAKEALEMNASCSYWISARDRIMSQMVVYEKELAGSEAGTEEDTGQGYILPQIIPMGTITRRAVENTWLTASNAKKNRVGSELKSIIEAPPGYAFVGADVDSQELWIASLVGDAAFRLHGGNAIGFMTLEGTKAAGTDLHSKTAQILGISRNDAKIFNYGRIYGAGVDFAKTLLRRFNPGLREEEAQHIARTLYRETKGERTSRRALHERRFWRGGTESLVFNQLEAFAERDCPRTPVLGAGITEALRRRFVGHQSQFLTSRVNWAIQSSGVDYLHLLIVAMDFLCRRYNIRARLALTVHDEIRYLAREEDRYRCALALQVANIWTRAMFAEQMGMMDLPQGVAFFSAVDIDHVLRKEVEMDCITPSHLEPIPPGESLDMVELLAKGWEVAGLDPKIVPEQDPPPRPERFEYTPRKPVMMEEEVGGEKGVEGGGKARLFLRAQIAESISEVNRIVKEIKPAVRTSPGGDSHYGDGVSPSSHRKSAGSTIPAATRISTTSRGTSSKKKTTTTTTKKMTPASFIPVEIPFDNDEDYSRAYSLPRRPAKERASPPFCGNDKRLSAELWSVEGSLGKGDVRARQQ